MRFYEFDQGPIRIFDVRKVTGCFTHVETIALVVGKAIDRGQTENRALQAELSSSMPLIS